MINLQLKDGRLIEYDEAENKVYINGKVNSNWSPTFIPNGDEEPTLFGFVDKTTATVYDVYGGVSKVVDEDKIKL